jgi:CheY-like chemotaxis protein
MTSVLVVDDSPVDLRLVGGLLEERTDFEVRYAEDGVEAMAEIQRRAPDLVLTDLMMPKMDGLELVTLVRQKHPLVPVVLITGRGNEEIAVEALERGAASYVPKRNLSENLLDTVQTVLALSHHKRQHEEMMGCLTRQRSTFVLDNDPTLIYPLVSHLQEQTAQMGLGDEGERTRLGVALEVALTNALYHGNLEIDPELRQNDRRACAELAARRCRQPPYQDRRIYLDWKLSRHGGLFVVRDEGSGLDFASLPDLSDPASLEQTGSRRMLLMRTLVDEVVYNETGRTVTLVKRWNS